MAECRCQGIFYNCDETYVRDHLCQWLFFLEAADYLDNVVLAGVASFLEEDAEPAATEGTTIQPMVLLHAIAGIHIEDTMHLHVYIHGHRLLTLLDSSSMHNFINAGSCANSSRPHHPTPLGPRSL
jgi:hypothetical protein